MRRWGSPRLDRVGWSALAVLALLLTLDSWRILG